MRLVPVLFLVACAPADPSGIAWRSTLDATTKGVALHAGGSTGHAGMYNTNCPFETVRGQVTGDYQLPDEGEAVQDEGPSPLGPNTVLLALDENVWFLDKTAGTYVLDSYPAPGLVAGRLTSDGTAILRTSPTGCSLEWNGEDFATTATYALPTCPGEVSFDVEPDSGVAVLAETGQVELVAPIGDPVVVDLAANVAVWDESQDIAYVALLGTTEIHAIGLDGASLWTADVGFPITAIGAAGSEGGLAVAVANGSEGGLLLLGVDGAEVGFIDTPSAAIGIDSSPEGAVLAAIRPDHVYFFDLDRTAF